MKKISLLLLVVSIMLGCKKPSTTAIIEITNNKVLVNTVEISDDWKLDKTLSAIGGSSREIKLHRSSYFIYDKLGIVIHEESSAFKPKPRGYVGSFTIFFKGSNENNDWPKNGFNGKLTMEGVAIDGDFKQNDLNKFNPSWHRSESMGSKKIENNFIKAYFTFGGEKLLYINFAPQ